MDGRRARQLAEIERLLAHVVDERAGGLIAEHVREFPDDASAVRAAIERLRDDAIPPRRTDG